MAEQLQDNMDIGRAVFDFNNPFFTLRNNIDESEEKNKSLMKVIRGSSDEKMNQIQENIAKLSLDYTDVKKIDALHKKCESTQKRLCFVTNQVIFANTSPDETINIFKSELDTLMKSFKDVQNDHQTIINNLKMSVSELRHEGAVHGQNSRKRVQPSAEVRASVVKALVLDAKGFWEKLSVMNSILYNIVYGKLPSNILVRFAQEFKSMETTFYAYADHLENVIVHHNKAKQDFDNMIRAVTDIDKKVKEMSHRKLSLEMKKVIFIKIIQEFIRVDEYREKYFSNFNNESVLSNNYELWKILWSSALTFFWDMLSSFFLFSNKPDTPELPHSWAIIPMKSGRVANMGDIPTIGNMDISGALDNLNNSVTTVRTNLCQSYENMQSIMQLIRGSSDKEIYKLKTHIHELSLKYTVAKNKSDYLCRKTNTTKEHLSLVAREFIHDKIKLNEAMEEYADELKELVDLFTGVCISHQSIIEEMKALSVQAHTQAEVIYTKSEQAVTPTAEVLASVLSAVTLDAKGISGKLLAINCTVSALLFDTLPSGILKEFTKQNTSLAKIFFNLETELQAVSTNAYKAKQDLENITSALLDIDNTVKKLSNSKLSDNIIKLRFQKCINEFTRVEEYGAKYSEKTKPS